VSSAACTAQDTAGATIGGLAAVTTVGTQDIVTITAALTDGTTTKSGAFGGSNVVIP